MKKLTAIMTAVTCCAFSLFALTGCDALGLSITEQGIRAEDSNVLLIGIIVIIILMVLIQRFFQR